jgi:hypothetical protein
VARIRVYRAEFGVGGQARIYRAEVTAPGTPTSVRVYRVEVSSPGQQAAVRIYRAELAAGGTQAHARVYRAEVQVTGSATFGPDLYGIEPWTTVTVAATAPGTPTSWVFSQVSGPAVTLIPSGNTVSFQTPGGSTTQTIVLQAVANYSNGSIPAADNTSIEVLYATEYINTSTGWVPARFQTMA